jgi:uncharacterized LabA/DUF88 family protein
MENIDYGKIVDIFESVSSRISDYGFQVPVFKPIRQMIKSIPIKFQLPALRNQDDVDEIRLNKILARINGSERVVQNQSLINDQFQAIWRWISR